MSVIKVIFTITAVQDKIMPIAPVENHNSFVNNRIKRSAIERLIQIIGEAANHLSGDFIQENQTFTAHCVIGHARKSCAGNFALRARCKWRGELRAPRSLQVARGTSRSALVASRALLGFARSCPKQHDYLYWCV
ncbi:HepT-like ribonuclease domain-containing protein [Treponema socranskii]|uniref:HepT-like ribonuclease domain-containing protein n=1 Tax=Treponema socranskii TaxID=53419 RepID=UPI003D900BB4